MKIFNKLLIGLSVGIILLMIAVMALVYTFKVERFKPQIVNQLSKVLNRQVDFESIHLDLSLFKGITLVIGNLIIPEDPAFGDGAFLSVKNLYLNVDVFKYLFKKEVNIPNISLDSAYIKIIRQKDGSLNAQSFVKPAELSNQGLKPLETATPLALPFILISSLKGSSCSVMYIDRSFEPAVIFEIAQIDFLLNNVSLDKAFTFSAEAAILSNTKNIRLGGKVQIDLGASKVTISELKGAVEFTDVILDKIPVVFPMTKGAFLPNSLKGNSDISLNTFIIGQEGLQSLNGSIILTNGGLRFKEMAVDINDIQLNINITEEKVVLNKASGYIGDGVIDATGVIRDYLGKQEFNFEVKAQNVRVQDLLASDKLPAKAEGLASAKIKIKGLGFTEDALKSNLSGDAGLSVVKAKLKDINVFRTVLDKISVIPGLTEKLESGLPERFKNKLSGKDTVLRDIELPLAFENGKIILKNTILGTEEFLFEGKGEAGFDSNVSLEGSFLIPAELSESIIAEVSELQYLLNADKQIYIPLKVSGKAGELKFNVDGEYIAKKLLGDQVKTQIFKAIDKYLGPKEETSDATGKTQPSAEQSVGGILDKLLNK